MKKAFFSSSFFQGAGFLSALSKAVNAYLALDPQSALRLKKLNGQTITIELLPFHFIFHCTFQLDGILIGAGEAVFSDARLVGTPLQMAGAMIDKENRQQFFANDLTLSGKADMAQQVVELFDELYIDWEDLLARWVGDVPAYHAGRLLKQAGDWLRRADRLLTENVSDYLHEEINWFPVKEALQDFFNDIDVMRMDVDRLAARTKQLHDLLADTDNHHAEGTP